MKDKEYNLDRFLKVQELMYPWALREIKNGRKQTHWSEPKAMDTK